MARASRAVGLLCAAAAGTASLGFVAPRLLSLRALQPSIGLTAAAWPETQQFSEPEPAPQAEQGSSLLTWLGAGMLAGIMLAASAAPADAYPNDFHGPSFAPGKSLGPDPDTQIDLRSFFMVTPTTMRGGFPDKNGKFVAGLELCKDSKKFHKKIKEYIGKLEKRQKNNLTPGGVVYKWFDMYKEMARKREVAYGERFCGKLDGLPRVIPMFTTNRGSILYPTIMFLYTAGWIGWAGRSYLQRTQSSEKELQIDVPLALQCMASGFSWPVSAWQEITTGKMAVPDSELPNPGMARP